MPEMDKSEQARAAEEKSVDPLLQGAIDMHYHGYPEFSLRVKSRLDDVGALKLAGDLGMRGIVIKSQLWPSMGRVYHLRQRVSGVDCFSSITLNSIAGGLSPWIVEAAARQGCKVVWLPTWSSTHMLGQGGFSQILKGWFPSMSFEPGLCCTDSSGTLTAEVRSIIRVARDMELVLCTGHISPLESLAVAREAERIGFGRLILTHPLSGSVKAKEEEIKEMTKRGAYVEFCALDLFLGRNMDVIPAMINKLGPRHCILSTDAFWEWVPPGPELLRTFVGRLLMVSGIDEECIRVMIQKNPTALLGLTQDAKSEPEEKALPDPRR